MVFSNRSGFLEDHSSVPPFSNALILTNKIARSISVDIPSMTSPRIIDRTGYAFSQIVKL
jgi:hypothetical protein